jgi:hypothetical protein
MSHVAERTAVLPVNQLVDSVFEDYPESFSLFELVGDTQRLVEAALDGYFYGVPMDGVDTRALLTSYGVPTEQAQRIAEALEARIAQSTLIGFQRIYPSRCYEYRLLSPRHAVVTERAYTDYHHPSR